ncbi:MAG: VOC family protein [Propionicimonas sp.]|uniref:VOC family protein n=1 Tax=Propionicimonas sp. TaxID=1955623 RepID=UPI003D1130B0
MFRTPQVVLFTKRIEAAAAFYRAVGFTEVFREPAEGKAVHVDLELDGYRIGLATERSAREDHWLEPVASGQRAAVVLWTDDVRAGFDRLVELGAEPVHEPSMWLDRLLIAWLTDPDGHLLQVVQEAPTR